MRVQAPSIPRQRRHPVAVTFSCAVIFREVGERTLSDHRPKAFKRFAPARDRIRDFCCQCSRPFMAHRDGRHPDHPPSLSEHCGHRPIFIAHRSAANGGVEMWRGYCRSDISVSAPFVWRCLSGSTVTPFPHPARRTGQAALPHPAPGQDFTPSPTARRAQVRRPACPSRAYGWSS
jgi:hypothetical protein